MDQSWGRARNVRNICLASPGLFGCVMPLIVIVDDRVSNRNIFARLAASIEPEITVRTFGEPAAALDWLAHNPPDLVITDYKMPEMDGAEFIRHFRQLPACAEIPVIVITVYEERSFRLCALEAGATDFLHSPVDHHEFITRARNLLKLHQHQQLLASRAQNLEEELAKSELSRQSQLRDSATRLEQVIDTIPAMIRATNADGVILFANAYQATFANINPSEAVGKTVSDLHGIESGARHQALDRVVFDTGKSAPAFEEELADASGSMRIFITSKSPLVNANGGVSAVLTSSLDITARKRTEAHLRHMAHHDPLTNLPNRNLLRERMRKLIARARRGDNRFAVHIVDLDGFKKVNDLLGHSAGDRYIKAISTQLKGLIRDEDTLARLGGDEFAILQANVASEADAATFAARLLTCMETSSGFEEAPVQTTASIGIAIHPQDGADSETLIKNADLAMYRAKNERGNSFCFYASDMNARARAMASLDSRLRRAISNHEFVLHYQPQIDLTTGVIDGAEALLRWNDPEIGMVPPKDFLPRAEENGLIVPISEWVLEQACSDARKWQTSGLRNLRVSVNLSPVQFQRRTVPLHVARVLASTGLNAHLLDLEITESIVMRDVESVANDLQQLLNMGVHLSIDDFGTGYSSLSYVKRLPVNRLKIDQSFIKTLTTDQNDIAIIRAILTLGQSLDLTVIAEGVETAEQAAVLRNEGCRYAQGYFFGVPMTHQDFVKFAFNSLKLAKLA